MEPGSIQGMMSIPGSDDIVKILSTGIAGLAVIMLYLSYKLTADIQQRLFDTKMESFPNLEMYREWRSTVKHHNRMVLCFFLLALIFFAGGLFLTIYQKQNQVTVELLTTTDEIKKMFEIECSAKEEKGDLGSAVCTLPDGGIIKIGLDEFAKELASAKAQIVANKKKELSGSKPSHAASNTPSQNAASGEQTDEAGGEVGI